MTYIIRSSKKSRAWKILRILNGKRQKLGGHFGTNKVMAAVCSVRSAITISEKASDRAQATTLERSSQNIAAKVCRLEIVFIAHIENREGIDIGGYGLFLRFRAEIKNFGRCGPANFRCWLEPDFHIDGISRPN